MNDQARKRLLANDFVYRQLRREAERLRRRGDPTLLSFIQATAEFAWWSHPGRLADGTIENILLDVGRRLAPVAEPFTGLPKAATSRTLHVASELLAQGGHTRVLAKWVQRDVSSSHAIVVTRQPGDLPAFVSAIAADAGAPITILNQTHSIADRAVQLRALGRTFDRIILHHHPDDLIPTLAFAVAGGCPVVMFNHAHFWFSFGSGVSDMIVNTMPYFRRLTEKYRLPALTGTLEGPYGLDPLPWTDIDKPQAKRKLGLQAGRPVIMTIGSERYFTPSADLDFFETLDRLLSMRPDLQVLVVGVGAQSPLVPEHIRTSDNVRLVGTVSDPRPYYEAADLCLESFPMPSLGALMEAVAYGQAFPVPAFAEAESPSRVDQQRIASIAVRQRTEEEYLRYIIELLDRPVWADRRAADLRRTLVHDDAHFGDQFPALYARIDPVAHMPRHLPATECQITPESLELASMTDPFRIGQAINLLPLTRAIATHVHAVILGHETFRIAARAAARRLITRMQRQPSPAR